MVVLIIYFFHSKINYTASWIDLERIHWNIKGAYFFAVAYWIIIKVRKFEETLSL